jgi:hypothetical protein
MLSGRFGPLNKKKKRSSVSLGLYFLPVLRIRDVLIRNRIRILGFVHWITDSDLDLFFKGLQDPNKKYVFFCLLLTLGTFISAFKNKKSFRSQKTVEIKVYLKQDPKTFSENLDITMFWQKDKKNAEIQEVYNHQ